MGTGRIEVNIAQDTEREGRLVESFYVEAFPQRNAVFIVSDVLETSAGASQLVGRTKN